MKAREAVLENSVFNGGRVLRTPRCITSNYICTVHSVDIKVVLLKPVLQRIIVCKVMY